MSNYQRTMELVGFANNSAGASQKQFNKTMESLESKLNRLHVAWETFTTGIANAGVIKGAVDLLTELLTAINKITEATDPFHTGITKILVAILGFKGAKSIVNKAVRNIGGQLASGLGLEGQKAGKTFYQKFVGFLQKNKSASTKGLKNFGALDAIQDAPDMRKGYANAYRSLSKDYTDYANSLATIQKMEQEGTKDLAAYNEALAMKQKAVDSVSKTQGAAAAAEMEKMTVEQASAKATELNTVATQVEAGAITEETIAEQASTMSKGQAILALFTSNGAKKAAAMVTLGLASAEEAEALATEGATGAQTLLNAAIYACPIGWIVAGIAALVGILWAVSAIIETDAEKFERLSTTAENASTAASEANSALSEISSSKSSLETLNQELDDLTAGTDEWKQKLIEVNAEVLKLIEQYPDLTKYVKNVNGQLTIESEGWDEIYNKQLEAAQQAITTSAVAKGLLAEHEQNTTYDNITKEQKGLEYTTQNEQTARSFVTDLTSGSNATKINEQNSEIITQALATNDIIADVEELKNTIQADVREYGKLMNLTEEQIKEKQEEGKLTDDQIRTALATNKYQEKVKNQIQKLNTKLEVFNATTSGSKDIFTGLISKNGMNIASMDNLFKTAHSKNIMSQYKDFTDLSIASTSEVAEQLRLYFEEVYQLTEEELEQMGLNLEGLAANLIEDSQILYDAYEKTEEAGITKFVNDSIANIEKKNDYKFDTTEIETYADTLASIKFQGGDVKEFQEYFSQLIESFDGDKSKISSFIKSFKDIDLTSGKSILTSLEQFGNSLDKNVRKKLIDTTNATKDFSLVTDAERKSYIDNANKIREINESNQKVFDYNKDSDKETIDFLKGLKEDLKGKGLKWSDFFIDDKEQGKFYVKNLDKLIEAEIDLIQGNKNAKVAQDNLTAATERYTKSIKKAKEIVDGKTTDGKTYNSEDIAKSFVNNNNFISDLSNGIYKFSNDFLERLNNPDNEMSYFTAAGAVNDRTGRNLKFSENFTELIKELNTSTNLQDAFFKMAGVSNKEEFSSKVAEAATGQDTDFLDKIQAMAIMMQEDPKIARNMSKEDYNFISQAIVEAINKDQYGLIDNKIKEYWTEENKNKNSFAGDYVLRPERQQSNANVQNKIDEAYKSGLLTDQDIDVLNNIKDLNEKTKRLNELLTQRNKTDVDKAREEKVEADKTKYSTAMSARDIVEAAPENARQLKSQEKVLDTLIKQHDNWKKRLKEIEKEYGVTETAAKRILAVEYEQNSVVDSIVKSLSDNEKVLVPELKGTEAYDSAIQDLVTKFQTIFGDKISAAWVEENLEAIKQLSEGGEVADAAMQKLANTSEAALAKVESTEWDIIQKSFKNLGLDNDVYNSIETAYGNLADYITGKTDSIAGGVNGITSALNKLDGSSADVKVTAETEDAFAELIRLGLVQALIDNDFSRYKQLLDLAYDSGFGTKNIKKTIDYRVENGQIKRGFSADAVSYWKDIDIAVREENGELRKRKDRKLESSSSSNVKVSGKGTGSAGVSTDTNKDKSSKDKDSSSKDTNKWINDWDKYYSILQKIEAIDRKRTQLERTYSSLVESSVLNEKEIKKAKKQQLSYLKQQIKLNQTLQNSTLGDLSRLNQEAKKKFGKGVIKYDFKLGAIQTNDKKIQSFGEERKGEFDTLQNKFEDLASKLNTANDNIDDAIDAMKELSGEFEAFNFDAMYEHLNNISNAFLSFYEAQAKRLERPESAVSSKDIEKNYRNQTKERLQLSKSNTERYIQTKAEIQARLGFEGAGKYYKYNDKTGEVATTKAYKQLTDSTVRKKVNEEIAKLRELSEEALNLNKENASLEAQQYEAQKAIAEKANEFERSVYDAVVNSREKEIESLENINSSIQDASSKLIDSMQKSIQKIRQDRKNEKTEQELSDTQAKISYLQADTSGANEVEILKLQKQLDEKQESYTDSLIDQKISELQDQNKEAAEQRKIQIELAKAQLEYDKENGVLWNQVYSLIATGLTASGTVNKNSELGKLLAQSGKLSSMNAYEKKQYWGSMNYASATYTANETIGDSNDYAKIDNTISKDVYNDLKKDQISEAVAEIKEKIKPYSKYMKYDSKKNKLSVKKGKKKKDFPKDALDAWYEARKLVNYIKNLKKYYKNNKGNTIFSQDPTAVPHYQDGGLVDYTGLKWLDGTPSSPELVLNAKDTQNFLALKDVLSSLMKGGSTFNQNASETNYEIQINVDSISSDYDVDKIAARIKYDIMKDAKYRNVNNLTTMR